MTLLTLLRMRSVSCDLIWRPTVQSLPSHEWVHASLTRLSCSAKMVVTWGQGYTPGVIASPP
jgi:hypothetical protein